MTNVGMFPCLISQHVEQLPDGVYHLGVLVRHLSCRWHSCINSNSHRCAQNCCRPVEQAWQQRAGRHLLTGSLLKIRRKLQLLRQGQQPKLSGEGLLACMHVLSHDLQVQPDDLKLAWQPPALS